MKYLILGPGSTGFFALFGYLMKLHDKDKLQDLEEISGSSAGSLLAFCYLIGKNNLPKLKEYVFSVDVGSALKIKLKNILKFFGLVDKEIVKKEISSLCHEFTDLWDVSFEQLYQMTGIKFHVPAYSLKTKCNVYFSVDSHPSKSVVDVICSSISIPLIFPPYDGFLDGSIAEEIPWLPFADKPYDDCLAIRISGETEEIHTYDSFIRYIMDLINVIYYMRDKNKKIPTVIVDTGKLNTLNFQITHDDKLKAFVSGYSTML